MAGVDPRDVAVSELMAAARKLSDLNVSEEYALECVRRSYRVRVVPGEVVVSEQMSAALDQLGRELIQRQAHARWQRDFMARQFRATAALMGDCPEADHMTQLADEVEPEPLGPLCVDGSKS